MSRVLGDQAREVGSASRVALMVDSYRSATFIERVRSVRFIHLDQYRRLVVERTFRSVRRMQINRDIVERHDLGGEG